MTVPIHPLDLTTFAQINGTQVCVNTFRLVASSSPVFLGPPDILAQRVFFPHEALLIRRYSFALIEPCGVVVLDCWVFGR